MEDEKLVAYYDDMTRRGGGAARFKQGLGFSGGEAVPSRGSALPSASSFISGFVRASSPSKTSEWEKQAQLHSIQNKLSKKPKEKVPSRSPSRNSILQSRSSSRDRIRDKHSKRRSRSRSRDRYSRRRGRSRSRDRRSRRSRSREDEGRRRNRSRSRSREKNRETSKRDVRVNGGIDYAKSIEGYDRMTPAEKVRAKMKLQLSKTAEKDEAMGKGSGWERFDFDKDAPLDDEEIEAAEDDAVLVKNMGQSFRFSAVEARREDELKAAHDDAMFGGSSHPLPAQTDEPAQGEGSESKSTIESGPAKSLLSEQVLTMQRGSWRDRARKS